MTSSIPLKLRPVVRHPEKPVALSDAARREIDAVIARYPEKRAAMLPVLWLFEREVGEVNNEVERQVWRDDWQGAIERLTGVPLVITTHGTDVEMLRRTRWARRLARFAFGRARAVTCGSTYLKEQLLALGVVDRERVSVAPMPVNLLFQTSCLQRRSGAARSPCSPSPATRASCRCWSVSARRIP